MHTDVLDPLDRVGVPQAEAVHEYVCRHPDMIDLLARVSHAARERLGPHTQLSLEVYHDPEIEDEYLTLYVRPDDDAVAQVMDIIEQISGPLDQELAEKSGWLIVTLDLRATD